MVLVPQQSVPYWRLGRAVDRVGIFAKAKMDLSRGLLSIDLDQKWIEVLSRLVLYVS